VSIRFTCACEFKEDSTKPVYIQLRKASEAVARFYLSL